MTRKFLTGAAGVLAVSVTSPLSAQGPAAAQDTYLDSLKSCQAVIDDAQRLVCYDKAVGNVVTASDQGDLKIVDREQTKETKRRFFGFSLPKLGIFGDDEEDEEIESLESVVASASVSGRKTLFFTIEDGGALWQIKDAPAHILRTQPGAKVVFKKASMGTYFIRINGRTGVRGTRVK